MWVFSCLLFLFSSRARLVGAMHALSPQKKERENVRRLLLFPFFSILQTALIRCCYFNTHIVLSFFTFLLQNFSLNSSIEKRAFLGTWDDGAAFALHLHFTSLSLFVLEEFKLWSPLSLEDDLRFKGEEGFSFSGSCDPFLGNETWPEYFLKGGL